MENLPVELVKEIKYFYQPIEIKIVDGWDYIYFHIHHYPMTIKIKTRTENTSSCREASYAMQEYLCDDRYDDALYQFIVDLYDNKDCFYDESHYYDCERREAFQIEIEGEIIKIGDGITSIDLPRSYKNQLLTAMKQYHAMCHDYLENVDTIWNQWENGRIK